MDGDAQTATRQLPELPERLSRWSVDRHYTALVDALRGDGPPGAVSLEAHERLVGQIRTTHPDSPVPDYVMRLGQDLTATQETPHE